MLERDAVNRRPAASACGDVMAKRKLSPEPLRLDHALGYLPDGVSAHSHWLASGRGNAGTNFRDRAPAHQPPRNSTVTELILRHRHELAKLVDKLNGDLTPVERAKAESNREIKIRFLERLSAEYQELISKGARDV